MSLADDDQAPKMSSYPPAKTNSYSGGRSLSAFALGVSERNAARSALLLDKLGKDFQFEESFTSSEVSTRRIGQLPPARFDCVPAFIEMLIISIKENTNPRVLWTTKSIQDTSTKHLTKVTKCLGIFWFSDCLYECCTID